MFSLIAPVLIQPFLALALPSHGLHATITWLRVEPTLTLTLPQPSPSPCPNPSPLPVEQEGETNSITDTGGGGVSGAMKSDRGLPTQVRSHVREPMMSDVQ